VKKERILVTGGGGYVGSVVTLGLLKAGYAVTVIDNLTHSGDGVLSFYGDADYEFVKADIRDYEKVRGTLKKVVAVIHLAAIVGDPASKKFPKDTVEINKEASIQLIDMAQEAGIGRFIFFSTCSNYGIADFQKLSDEETPLKPISLYAETKVAVEKYLLAQKHPGFSPLVLRVSTVFGCSPRMRFDLTINQFVMEAIRDRKLVIFSPKAWRPYIHIRDVADAVLACIQAEESKVRREVYNLGRNDMSFTKMEIATLVQKMIPGTEVEIKGAGTDLRDYRVDFSKWVKSFPGIPSRTIEQGLAELKSVLEDWKIISHPEQEKYHNA